MESNLSLIATQNHLPSSQKRSESRFFDTMKFEQHSIKIERPTQLEHCQYRKGTKMRERGGQLEELQFLDPECAPCFCFFFVRTIVAWIKKQSQAACMDERKGSSHTQIKPCFIFTLFQYASFSLLVSFILVTFWQFHLSFSLYSIALFCSIIFFPFVRICFCFVLTGFQWVVAAVSPIDHFTRKMYQVPPFLTHFIRSLKCRKLFVPPV